MVMFQISGKVHKQSVKLWEQKTHNSLEHECNTCPRSAWMCQVNPLPVGQLITSLHLFPFILSLPQQGEATRIQT
jgi:hypothetical protein